MGNEAGAGHFLSAPYFQTLDNPTNQKFVQDYFASEWGKCPSSEHCRHASWLANGGFGSSVVSV
jgi:urea transport system substrate-binding protein